MAVTSMPMDILPDIIGANFNSSIASLLQPFASQCSYLDASLVRVLNCFANQSCASSVYRSIDFVSSSSTYSWADRHISRAVFSSLSYIGLDVKPSPFVTEFPFLASPTSVVLSIIVYLTVVLGASIRMRLAGTKPRKEDPLPLWLLVVFHNLFLCGVSLYMGIGFVVEAWRNGYTLLDNHFNPKETKMAILVYIFYISKIYEFMDTAIMVMKGNLRQISWLHIYHHASISFIWWMICYMSPGGNSFLSAMINSWIHVFMYAYYLLAATVAKDQKMRRKYLFWGKYLTMLQMVQFGIFMFQATYGMFHPEIYPPSFCTLLFFYSLSLLLFFANFFTKKHILSRSSKPTAKVD